MKKFFLVLLRFFFGYGQRQFVPYAASPTPTIIKNNKAIQNISFFIVAHPDDIELFMGKEARHQVLNSDIERKVFIVLSAGDANRKNRKKPFRKVSWWQAREQAHTTAISFWNDHKNEVFEQEITINGRYITEITIGSDISLYNFRFPDADKNTSLAELVYLEKDSISDLAHQQRYSLEDIKQSLIEIIELESKYAQRASFYIMDCDHERNPDDHKDHQATSLIVLDILPKLSIKEKSLSGYLTYFIKTKPINLEGEDREKSFETWALMGEVLDCCGYKKNDDEHHMQWVGKEYKSFSIQPDHDLDEINNLNKLRIQNK
ncbi:PIG-L family deacetylase [Acinetobacter sp. VNH17]|uniref:PIG-L family deacetylase n=1 Tax=Acinetobacter thutiue TaxID=2998078 RepID=A0ABT7WSP9_9GAMM|nr:PIG-L family deacetylase [Acinetobacter thutiue]MCY6413597.1 PIG-L family deacetylase [Acinetobacter thutiue]MDN0015706.1 PIG-L family deacetylase [Acinetobacter thutiue]